MHPRYSSKARRLSHLLCVLASFALAKPLCAQTLLRREAPPALRPAAETLDTLAHRVLNAGLALNGLTESEPAPWHLRLEYQLLQPGYEKPVRGSLEEWYAGPHRWKRTWTGVEPSMAGTQWSVAPYQRFVNRRATESVEHIRLDLHVARPAIDPLQRATLIRAEDPMDIKIVKTEQATLNCISVLAATHDAPDNRTDPRFSTLCFDKLNYLRLATSENLAVEFEEVELFGNRAVAHHVKVLANHRLVADTRIKLLEPLSDSDRALLKPPRSATPQPLLLEPGFPAPVAIFEAGAHVPLQPDGFPYRGRVLAMLVIGKDGSVRINRDLSFAPAPAVLDSIELAVSRWKYQQYKLDGESVQVKMAFPYILDGKPFVPTYKREAPSSLMDPEDYLSAETYGEMQGGGGPARRRRGR